MSNDLGRRLCDWVLRCRRDPSTPPPPGLFEDLWSEVLREPVLRHRLAPEKYDPGATNWDSVTTRNAVVMAFLQDEVLWLPEHDLEAGLSTALLVCMADHWVWREHARQDPLGARVYQALRRAVRELLASGKGGVQLAPGRTDAKEWVRHGALAGAGGESVTSEDLRDLLHRGGWRAGLLRCGVGALQRWMREWLIAVPTLWTRGPWPGCPLRLVLDALLTRARADAPRSHSVEDQAWVLDVADPAAQESATTVARRTFVEWLERKVLAGASVRPEFSARFLRSVRTEIFERTNRPRNVRCARLAAWMLARVRDRITATLAAMSPPGTDDERLTAVGQVVGEELQAALNDWPDETELNLDFYRPRIRRGLFREVQRVQQTEDRDLVRTTVLRQLQGELP